MPDSTEQTVLNEDTSGLLEQDAPPEPNALEETAAPADTLPGPEELPEQDTAPDASGEAPELAGSEDPEGEAEQAPVAEKPKIPLDKPTTPIADWLQAGIGANTLRVLALVLMLGDHLWATLVPGNDWLTFLGRMAFPIFAFQVSEGYFHTKDLKKYIQRLFLFALVSEIPFDLMMASTPFFPFHQNVLFTLLLGLLAADSLWKARTDPGLLQSLQAALVLLLCCMGAGIGATDYGIPGVLTVVLFTVFRGFRWAWVAQAVGMWLLHGVLMGGQQIILVLHFFIIEFPVQGLAVMALLPIWLYNGEKGSKSGKLLQWGSYLFYPGHMLLLYLLFRLR